MDKKQTEALRIATESLPMLKIAASLGDETGQISFHSSHLLNLIEGYNAARQEIASLRAQPYDQQAMGLCHVCGWKGVIDYPDGPVCVACEHDKALSPQPAAQAALAALKHPAVKSDMLVNGGALKLALNVLRRAGKNEVADELECTAQAAPVDADVRLERERLCAAIKAEDAYCVEHGDYMLDSDDCIEIVRGEWQRPDFAIAALAAQKVNHD